MSYIQWLDACEDPLAAGAGGKASSLIHLHKGGFPVPAGFVVCAAGYGDWVRHNELEARIESLLSVPDLHLPKVAREATADLGAALERADLAPRLAEEVCAAYRELQRRRERPIVTAVRSSAISEDGSGASSAGLYETFLNVRDEAALLQNIGWCYRSLWSHRAVQYRAFKRIDSRREAMAVVVMEMIPSRVSGVAFTMNPVTGSVEEVMINASWGLGEAIVSGRVTPDSFIVRKQDLQITSREIYDKQVMILPDPCGESGTVMVAVPGQRAGSPALDDDQVLELARLCVAIERYYGRPQDVEWAFDDTGLYVLQARPVTGFAR